MAVWPSCFPIRLMGIVSPHCWIIQFEAAVCPWNSKGLSSLIGFSRSITGSFSVSSATLAYLYYPSTDESI